MSEPIHMAVIVGKLWSLLVKFLPSFIGSFIAVFTMRFDANTPWHKRLALGMTAFAVGVACSYYFGSAIFSMYVLDPFVQDAIRFALGIFGLTLVNNVMSEISVWLAAIRKKILGE